MGSPASHPASDPPPPSRAPDHDQARTKAALEESRRGTLPTHELGQRGPQRPSLAGKLARVARKTRQDALV